MAAKTLSPESDSVISIPTAAALGEIDVWGRVLLAARSGKRAILAAGRDWATMPRHAGAAAWRDCDRAEARACPGSGGPMPLSPDGFTPSGFFALSSSLRNSAQHARLAAQHVKLAATAAESAARFPPSATACSQSVLAAFNEAIAAAGALERARICSDFEVLIAAGGQRGLSARSQPLMADLLPPVC